MKECETASQEAKEFIYFHEEVMEPTFSVNGCQCELIQISKDHLTKTKTQHETL